MRRPRRNIGLALFLGCAAGLAIVALVLKGPGDKSYEVPSEAMEPTYAVGEKVDVDEDAFSDGEPEVGDVVTLNPPVGAIAGKGCGEDRIPGEPCGRPTPELAEDILFIKRVVAGPGQSIAIRDGHPVVDGELVEEDFVTPCAAGGGCELPVPITIPADHYFVMGDNRGASEDSRFWGPVPLDAITGKVVGD